MITELKILNDVYKEDTAYDEDGNAFAVDKLVRKNVITLKTVDTAAISSVVQTIRKTGEVYKDRCVIYLKEEGHVLAKHRYEDIKRLIKPNILGYGGEESS